jgi:starvation-inducible DNA-binding protein
MRMLLPSGSSIEELHPLLTMTKSTLFKTHNDLPEKVREQVIDLLNQNLADIIDLGLQTKEAHWNVKGPHFIGLHLLFDEVAEELEKLTDTIAERAVALGGVAFGTSQVVAKRSQLAEYPLDISSGKDHVKALSKGLGAFGKSARKSIETAAAAGDAGTSDLFTEVSRGIDELLWKVEAHTQSDE